MVTPLRSPMPGEAAESVECDDGSDGRSIEALFPLIGSPCHYVRSVITTDEFGREKVEVLAV
jgi:hypothetical protein